MRFLKGVLCLNLILSEEVRKKNGCANIRFDSGHNPKPSTIHIIKYKIIKWRCIKNERYKRF